MAQVTAFAELEDVEISAGMRVIDYEHIPPQTITPLARAELVRVDATTLARSIGYIMGAGDTVPEALRQLGCDVTLLEAGDLSRGDLSASMLLSPAFEPITSGMTCALINGGCCHMSRTGELSWFNIMCPDAHSAAATGPIH